MKLIGLMTFIIVIWVVAVDAKTATSCNPSFNSKRLFKNQSTDRSELMKDTLLHACEIGLSDSQIAGKVLKSCLRSCDLPEETESLAFNTLLLEESVKKEKKTPAKKLGAVCKQSCFNSLQKMAKETLRIKNSRTVRK